MTKGKVCHKVYMEDIEKRCLVMYEQILKALREELEKALETRTQEEIAHICGTTQPTIQRILKGTRGQNLPLKTVLNIILGLNLDLLPLLSVPSPVRDKLKELLAEASELVAG